LNLGIFFALRLEGVERGGRLISTDVSNDLTLVGVRCARPGGRRPTLHQQRPKNIVEAGPKAAAGRVLILCRVRRGNPGPIANPNN